MTSDDIVHVIDDDEAARQSLEFLLQSASLPVRTYDSATAFLASNPPMSSGCIVTDLKMSDLNGIDLLRQLKERKAAMPVIVITGHGDIPLAVEAMKLGAIDFLEKPFDSDVLLEAVRSSLNKNAASAGRNADRAQINERIASLSAREREVLLGLVRGGQNKIIAKDLEISPRTVEIYRANLMTKMNATSLSDLVRMALVVGILEQS